MPTSPMMPAIGHGSGGEAWRRGATCGHGHSPLRTCSDDTEANPADGNVLVWEVWKHDLVDERAVSVVPGHTQKCRNGYSARHGGRDLMWAGSHVHAHVGTISKEKEHERSVGRQGYQLRTPSAPGEGGARTHTDA